ncbi:MAG: LacI family DNA-binding transcriptional regulator [Rhodococcus sp. (in: high G+C Gram-positive bacteria)]
MADVARAAGVSPALVSIVMRDAPGASDDTRARVRRIADQLGYLPDRRAQKLRQSTSRLIGVTFELQQPFHGDIVEQLYPAAAAHGYDIIISAVAPSRSENDALQTLLRERCDAAILMGSRQSDDALRDTASRIPSVVVARTTTARGVASVRSDDVAGIGLVVDHLVSLGHRSIAHIDGGDAPGSIDRRTSFLDATARHGLVGAVVPGGLSEADGSAGMRLLLDAAERPTAVVAFNDRCAAGVLDTLVRAGIDVPTQMSVVGYDDSRLAEVSYVGMTTVSQNAHALAIAAIDSALALGAGNRPDPVVLAPRLVVRATTGPVPT